MTPNEMAEEQRAKYRAQCQYARKGHVIYSADNGNIGEVYKHFLREVKIGKEKVTLPAVNQAKAWVRKEAPYKTFKV